MLRFSSVDDSQFGKLLVQFRSRMSAIKRKYADLQDGSLEREQADRQVEMLEGMLDTAQQYLLPQLDNGNVDINYASLIYHVFSHRNDHLQFESAEFKILQRIQALLPVIFKEAEAKSFTGNMTHYVSVYLKKYLFELKDDFYKGYVKTPGRDLKRFVSELQYYITAHGLYKCRDKIDRDNRILRQCLFNSNNNIPYTFDVGHLMMFEMLVETTKLANEVSENLHGFLSFLNPAIANLDLSSGFSGTVLSRFTDKLGKVEHVKDYQFNYIETDCINKKTNTYPFNAATLFHEFKEFTFSLLLSGIYIYISNVDDASAKAVYENFIQYMQQYFEANKESARVKASHARTALMLELIEKETAHHTAQVNTICAESRPDEYFTKLTGQELVAALQAEIENDNKKYSYYLMLTKHISNLRLYRFQAFVNKHPSMHDSIIQYSSQGCDISFLRAPAPLHAFQIIDNQLTIVPLLADLKAKLLQLRDDLNFDPKRYKMLREWARDPKLIPKTSKRGKINMLHRNDDAVRPQVPSSIEALRSDIEKLTERNSAVQVKSVADVNLARNKIKVTLAKMIQLTQPTVDIATKVDELVSSGEELNNWLKTAVNSFSAASEAEYYRHQLDGFLSRINNPFRFNWATFDEINNSTTIDKFLKLVDATDEQINQWKSCQTKVEKSAAIAMLKPLIIKKISAIDDALLLTLASNQAYKQFLELKMSIVDDCKTIIDFDYKRQLEQTLQRANLVEKFRTNLASYSDQLGMASAFVEMDNFIQTGEIDLLNEELFTARNNFMNDIPYRTLMNQAIVELHDLERDAKSLDYQTLRLNAEITEKTPEAQALYKEINILEQVAKSLVASHQGDGLVIQQLAKMLRRDVDCYLAGHADGNFLELFKVRLHSQDVIMEKHKSILPVLANIALLVFSVLSAGLVAAARVGYSKATTGKFTFFLNTDSALQQQADAIVRSVPAA